MRRALRPLLEIVGLAPSRDVRRLTERLAKLESTLARAHTDLNERRADTQSWKRRAEDAGKQVAAAERELRKAREALETSKTRGESQTAELRAAHARIDVLLGQLRDVKGKVELTERSARATGEQVLATEMKLDLVEAAISVLDRRSRRDPPAQAIVPTASPVAETQPDSSPASRQRPEQP